ncbi:MAG TPA: hypothetical protein VFM39_08755 [bacterium]|nr:hypothetical protein [bacterium]
MGFVVAAYLVVVALFALYVLSLTSRQRLITELANAAVDAAGSPAALPETPSGVRPMNERA